MESRTGPAGCDWGTRTEAGQNVPQANPEWADPSVWPSVVTMLVSAPRFSCAEGKPVSRDTRR